MAMEIIENNYISEFMQVKATDKLVKSSVQKLNIIANLIRKEKKLIKTVLSDRIIYTSSDLQIKQDLSDNFLTKYVKTTPGRILLHQAFKEE